MSKCVAKFAHPPSWKPKAKNPKLKMHSSAALPQKFFVVDIYENFHLQSLISGGDPIPLKKPPLFGVRMSCMSSQLKLQICMQSPGRSIYYFFTFILVMQLH